MPAIAIAAGLYTDIVELVAPDSAPAGSEVSITIRIKNTWTDYVHVSAIGVYDSVERFIDWLDYWIPAGATHSFSGSFIMPDKDVTIHAYSYYEDIDGYWRFDDEDEKDVRVKAVWQKLATKTVTITPEVVEWQKLATKTVTITPITWQKLATKTVTITPITWQKLATKTVTITPVPVEWVKLATKIVTITPEEIPPEYELLEETIYPYAYIYEGPHDGGTFTFKTDPFTPASWITGRLAAACEGEVRKAGGRVLEMRVYVDKSPLLWSDWRIEVITAPPRTTAGVAMPLGIAWWAVAILLALAIALIIVITWAVKEVAGLFKRKPGLEDVKVAWGKETLIKTIQDSEEYWERPLTPVETLEGMSEAELRDHLDKIAEEEVPEEISPWAIVALVGGLGVLGVGAAVALSMPRRE